MLNVFFYYIRKLFHVNFFIYVIVFEFWVQITNKV